MNQQSRNHTLKTNLRYLILLFFGTFLVYNCQDSLDNMSSSESSDSSISANSSGYSPLTMHSPLTMEVSESTGQEFKVFDATGFDGKPEMGRFGIRPIHIIYTHNLWKTKRTEENRWEFVSELMAAKNAEESAGLKSRAVMVDVQNWPTSKDPETTQKSTRRLSTLYYDLKRAKPNKDFGYFNRLPVKNWWPNPPSEKRLEIWKAKNDRLKKLAQKIDNFYLPGYTKTEDRDRWVRNMKYLIEEAERIGNGQPIYLVLWPQYHNGKKNYIEKDFWELQLETARNYADGVVLWAPHGTRWKDNAPWWNVTKQFMEDLGEYSEEPKVSDAKFKVYDSMRFRDKPDMSRLGFTPLEIVYQTRVWDKPFSEVGPWELPSQNLVKKWARKAYEINNEIMMINIEHWPTNRSESEVQRSLENYIDVYNGFKTEKPNMKIGYWGLVPFKLHWSQYPQAKWIEGITEKNQRLSRLADEVDVFFPDAYTYSRDKEGWLLNTKYMLKQAHKFQGDKPVYLVLWPQYLAKDNPELHEKFIEKDFWELQLETARKYADGVVIWFPIRTKWSEAEAAPWWNVTKDFLRDMGKAN